MQGPLVPRLNRTTDRTGGASCDNFESIVLDLGSNLGAKTVRALLQMAENKPCGQISKFFFNQQSYVRKVE